MSPFGITDYECPPRPSPPALRRRDRRTGDDVGPACGSRGRRVDPWKAGWVVLVLAGSGELTAQRPPTRSFIFDMAYLLDAMGPVVGGVERSAVALDNLDLKLRMDGRGLLGWPGLSAMVYVLSNRGSDPSELVGDAQGVSNITAPNAWRFYEAWVQQNVADQKISVLAGLYDVNTEFDVMQAAGLFLNSSFGIGPDYSQSGRNGPSIFPNTSLGIRIKIRPVTPFYVAVALLDGVPGDPADPASTTIKLSSDEGALLAFEAAFFRGAGEEPTLTPRVGARNRDRQIGRGTGSARYRGKLAIGGWAYTARTPAIDGRGTPDWNRGAYVLMERTLFRDRNEPRGVVWFGRAGVAHGRVNRFSGYVGTGATQVGPFPGRPDDEWGLAIATAINGDPYRGGILPGGARPSRAETVVEWTYRAQVHPVFAVQPDVQWVLFPNTDPSRGSVLVFGVRGEAAFRVSF